MASFLQLSPERIINVDHGSLIIGEGKKVKLWLLVPVDNFTREMAEISLTEQETTTLRQWLASRLEAGSK